MNNKKIILMFPFLLFSLSSCNSYKYPEPDENNTQSSSAVQYDGDAYNNIIKLDSSSNEAPNWILTSKANTDERIYFSAMSSKFQSKQEAQRNARDNLYINITEFFQKKVLLNSKIESKSKSDSNGIMQTKQSIDRIFESVVDTTLDGVVVDDNYWEYLRDTSSGINFYEWHVSGYIVKEDVIKNITIEREKVKVKISDDDPSEIEFLDSLEEDLSSWED